jgi:hypothetical protein
MEVTPILPATGDTRCALDVTAGGSWFQPVSRAMVAVAIPCQHSKSQQTGTQTLSPEVRAPKTAHFLAANRRGCRFESYLGSHLLHSFSTEESSMRRMHYCRLGEVDVVSETGLASTFQQPKQRSPFVCSGLTADDNDDAIVWPRRCEMEKVVPVASQ